MKFAFDFDGICTNLSLVRDNQLDEYEYLYSPFSITISEVRSGLVELASILGLFADLTIITSRREDAESYINDWLDKNGLSHLFATIYCCGTETKDAIMKKNGIAFLIDDKAENINTLTNKRRGIVWGNEDWIELCDKAFGILISISAVLKKDKSLILTSVKYVTDFGASPVFILGFNDNVSRKLRVCRNYDVFERILGFVAVAESFEYKHISRVISTHGIAIVKEYCNGTPLSLVNQEERRKYIFKIGVALAKLHAIPISGKLPYLKLNTYNGEYSLLVFSADNNNVVINPDKDIVFIDLEACNVGSRWIDYCWAKRLLCRDARERIILEKGYFSVYDGVKADKIQWKNIERDCKLWLGYQLAASMFSHSKNKNKFGAINDSYRKIWL